MANSRVIRELLVRLGVTVTPTTKADIQAMHDAIERVKSTMEGAAEGALTFGRNVALGARAAAGALAKLTLDAGQAAIEIERQARLLNLTREEYQKWLFVTQKLGGTQRDLADSFLQINDAAQRAIGGSKEMVQAFHGIGITTTMLKNKNPSELFDLIADRVAAATDKGKAMGIVSRLLGEEASRKLGPALLQGAAAVKALKDEAVKLGVVMSDNQLRALKSVGIQWGRLTGLVKGLRNVLAAALAPILERLLKRWADWLEANRNLIASGIERWVDRLRILLENLNRAVTAIGGWDVVLLGVAQGAGLLLLLANLGRLQTLLGNLRVLWAVIATVGGAAATALGIPFAALAAIVLGLVVAIGLLALGLEDLWVWWQQGDSLLKRNLDLIQSYIPAFGAVRELGWALVSMLMALVRGWGMLANAVLAGLAPAKQLLTLFLDPVLARVKELHGWWLKLLDVMATPVRGLTTLIEGATSVGERMAATTADAVQGTLAGAVQRQVDRVSGSVSNVDNSNRTANIQMNNTFGGGGARDVLDALDGAVRRAVPVLQGGRR